MTYKKYCSVCGIEFDTNMERKKVCSHACMVKKETINRNERNRASKTKIKRTCQSCGVEFETTNRLLVTCGGVCAKKQRSKMHNKWNLGVLKDAFGEVLVDAICPGCGKNHAKRVPKIDLGNFKPRYFCSEYPMCMRNERDFYPDHYDSVWESSCRGMI